MLVLFQYVDKHGKLLVESIRQACPQKTVHYIDGSSTAADRESIRQHMEQGQQQVLCASYGTTSLGVNITNLHTLIFASPSKSKIRVMQSIGRALRTSEGKTSATLIDLVDDLRIGKHVNYTFSHAQARIEYYSAEKFPFTLHPYPLTAATVPVNVTGAFSRANALAMGQTAATTEDPSAPF